MCRISRLSSIVREREKKRKKSPSTMFLCFLPTSITCLSCSAGRKREIAKIFWVTVLIVVWVVSIHLFFVVCTLTKFLIPHYLFTERSVQVPYSRIHTQRTTALYHHVWRWGGDGHEKLTLCEKVPLQHRPFNTWKSQVINYQAITKQQHVQT